MDANRNEPPDRSVRRRVSIAAVAGVGLILAFAAGCTTSPSQATAMSSSSAAGGFAADSPNGGAANGAASSAASSAAAAPGAPTAGGGKAAASGSGSKTNVAAGVEAQDRQVIRTANVTINIAVKSSGKTAAEDQDNEAKAVQSAYTVVTTLVANGPGYVSAASGRGATMSLTLRVPASGYDNVMAALKDVGPMTSLQESTEDVTSQMIDLKSRVETMTASVNRVRALLSQATKIGDVISIESELASREADLESLQRQQAGLAGQTSLSTITVLLQGSITGIKPIVAPAPPVARSGFLGGLANGWDAVRKVVHAGLTVVGTVIPFLPVVAVVVLGVLIWRRRVRRTAAPTLATPVGDPHAGE